VNAVSAVNGADCEYRVGFLRKRFESIMKDKSSKLQLLSGTEQFRKRIDKLLSWFLRTLCRSAVLDNMQLNLCCFVSGLTCDLAGYEQPGLVIK